MGVGPNGRMIVWSSQNRRAPPPEENAKRGWRIDGAGALQVEDGNDWNGKSPSGFHSHHLGRDPVLIVRFLVIAQAAELCSLPCLPLTSQPGAPANACQNEPLTRPRKSSGAPTSIL